jgi:hypothetical protein
MACAACHIDSEMDLIAWDLGDPTGQLQTNTITLPPSPITGTGTNHPMKGPMTTQTLRGLKGLDPFHWRGDRTNFTHFNIAFPGLLGGSALSTSDMNAYRDFINTVVFQPNPNQNLDRTYPTNFAGGDANAGRNDFFFTNYNNNTSSALQCTVCHTGPPGSGSDSLIITGVAKEEPKNAVAGPQNFKVPHLREAYQKLNFNNASNAVSIGGFGFVHDGTDPSLQFFLSRNVFTLIRNNTKIKNDLSAFVECFDTGTAPAVGYSRTIVAGNVNTTSISNDWALLENQAAVSNIDLIVKGTLGGQLHGLLYQPLSGTYLLDSTNSALLTKTSFTHADLVSGITNGGTLTLMGVPPGSGLRMGIDRDLDGTLDADVPAPSLQIAQAPGAAIFNWPFSAAGFGLEISTGLSPSSWTNVFDPLEIISGQNYVTSSPPSDVQFYRLKLQGP